MAGRVGLDGSAWMGWGWLGGDGRGGGIGELDFWLGFGPRFVFGVGSVFGFGPELDLE